MADKDLILRPRVAYDRPSTGKASEHAWWYEDAGGICIIVDAKKRNGEVWIRWGQLEAALKRKRK